MTRDALGGSYIFIFKNWLKKKNERFSVHHFHFLGVTYLSSWAMCRQQSIKHNIEYYIYYSVVCTWLRMIDRCKMWPPKKEMVHRKLFKSNAPTLLKLGVGRDHMYTKVWIFLSSCVMSSWNKTTCKSFVTKSEIMQ